MESKELIRLKNMYRSEVENARSLDRECIELRHKLAKLRNEFDDMSGLAQHYLARLQELDPENYPKPRGFSQQEIDEAKILFQSWVQAIEEGRGGTWAFTPCCQAIFSHVYRTNTEVRQIVDRATRQGKTWDLAFGENTWGICS